MRVLLGLAGALLAACAARSLPVPEPDLALADDPPAPPGPPREGRFEAAESREVRLAVEVGPEHVDLRAFCRVGVWTTLQELRPVGFVVRETWGRLGEREPRRLLRVRDQAVGGVVARLRPEEDGGLSFRVEVSAAALADEKLEAGEFFGKRVELARPRRHGYRFAGRAPAGYGGVLARWAGIVLRTPGDESGPAGGASFVVGEAVEAESFVEEWVLAEPVRVRADGVERIDYRLERRRRASGFQPDGEGWYNTYGAEFDLARDSGAVRFLARRGPADAR